MKLLEKITAEDILVALIVGVFVAVIGVIFKWLWVLSLQWMWRFIVNNRQQHRHYNFREIIRRVENEEYLTFKESEVNQIIYLLVMLCFLLLLLIFGDVSGLGPRDRVISYALALLMLLSGGLAGPLVAMETNRNRAARALRAGLTRDRRTKQYRWPPRKGPPSQPIPSRGSRLAKRQRRETD